MTNDILVVLLLCLICQGLHLPLQLLAMALCHPLVLLLLHGLQFLLGHFLEPVPFGRQFLQHLIGVMSQEFPHLLELLL